MLDINSSDIVENVPEEGQSSESYYKTHCFRRITYTYNVCSDSILTSFICAILMCCRVIERDTVENSISLLSHRMKDYFVSPYSQPYTKCAKLFINFRLAAT